jgi:N-glycosylase/DNA lyase
MKRLISDYKSRKGKIKERLCDFRHIHKGEERAIFQELCFCLFTPQSKALSCDKAVRELERSGLLFSGGRDEIKRKLYGVRFPNNKAAFLVCARELFGERERLSIKDKLDPKDIFKTREWLVKNVKGLGYKEASHFLRNIGLGKDLAILDVHILRNLKRYKVIKELPRTMSRKTYMDIEKKMRRFSGRIGIPMEELDLLFWSRETGVIFK